MISVTNKKSLFVLLLLLGLLIKYLNLKLIRQDELSISPLQDGLKKIEPQYMIVGCKPDVERFLAGWDNLHDFGARSKRDNLRRIGIFHNAGQGDHLHLQVKP